MRKTILLTLLFGVGGCATPNANYLPKRILINDPEIGVITEKGIGEILVRQGYYSTVPAVKVVGSFSVGAISGYRFEPGYYIKRGEDSDSEFFDPEPGPEGGKVVKGAISDPYDSMQVYKGSNKVCAITAFHVHVCKENAPIERADRPSVGVNEFQQSLIYSGKVGNKLRIGYREFSGSIARPAFNNEVEYDLDSSNTIGYKGAKIEVIQATNESIKYKLIKNFDSNE